MNSIIGNVGLLLATMVAKGLCTLDHLDHPSQSWRQQQADISRSTAFRGAAPHPWHNQARDWITANPEQWQALWDLHADRRAAMPRPRT